jgi:hypothetical protein
MICGGPAALLTVGLSAWGQKPKVNESWTMIGHSSIQTTERYLGSQQEIAIAVNDNLGL